MNKYPTTPWAGLYWRFGPRGKTSFAGFMSNTGSLIYPTEYPIASSTFSPDGIGFIHAKSASIGVVMPRYPALFSQTMIIPKSLAFMACALSLVHAQGPDLIQPLRFSVRNMDTTVAPGDDFYRFACGGWLKASTIPADRSSWSPSAHLMEMNTLTLRRLCEASAEKMNRNPVEQRVGDFYASASNETKIEELKFQPIASALAKIAALKTKEEAAALIGELHREGLGVFFGWYVDADARKSDTYALHIVQGGLSLPDRDYYLEKGFEKERSAFVDHVAKMLAMAGDAPTQAKTAATELLRLETLLAKASKPAQDLNDSEANYHKMTQKELANSAPEFPWAQSWKGMGVDPSYTIVGQPEYLAAMGKHFKEESLTSLQLYLRWNVLHEAAPKLHKAVDDENFAFYGTVLDGRKEQRARWKRAIAITDRSIGDDLGQLYAADSFPPAAKQRMEDMVANIKAAYAERIARTTWMTPGTRDKALAKLERFRAKLGYPSKWKDYAGLAIKRDDYFGNVTRAQQWEIERALKRIGLPVDRDEWYMTAPTVNAYFDSTKNEIVFPAGILQPPFFDMTMDDAVNYGATGATIGHEMTHGFDSDGRKFDAEGNLTDWWTEADAKEYERRAEVVVQQFNSLEGLPGVKVNGKLTLPENIADLGGLVIAYDALQRALAAHPTQRKTIDGLTPEQRFFISYAQSWSALQTDETLRQLITSDSHAPDHLRAYAPLQNIASWYQAFDVKPNAKLWAEPTKRAEIW